jgi:hypothetical protein
MKVRICPNCDTYNPPDAWSCAQCGHTLSINTLADVDHAQDTPSPGEPERDTAQNLKERVLYRSGDSFITNRQALISGEALSIDRIASVEKDIIKAGQTLQESEGERRPRPEDLFIAPGLAAKAIRSLTGIGGTRYVLRIHLKSGRVHEYVSQSEKPVDSMLATLTKAIARRR